MKRFTIIAAKGCRFNSGAVLGLTKEQYARRSHALEKARPGVYRVVDSVMFKLGEEIGVEGDVNKALMAEIADPDSAAARKVRKKAPRKPSGKKATSEKAADEKAEDDGIPPLVPEPEA